MKKRQFIVGFLVFLLAGVFLAKLYWLRLVWVQGPEMMPALQPGDLLLVKRYPREVRRGDVVLFAHPERPGVSIVRRIVGLPGESIQLKNEVLEVNGDAVVREKFAEVRWHAADQPPEGRRLELVRERWGETAYCVLKDPFRHSRDSDVSWLTGAYYVAADHRNFGTDSRTFGPIPVESVEGIVIMRLHAAKPAIDPAGSIGACPKLAFTHL